MHNGCRRPPDSCHESVDPLLLALPVLTLRFWPRFFRAVQRPRLGCAAQRQKISCKFIRPHWQLLHCTAFAAPKTSTTQHNTALYCTHGRTLGTLTGTSHRLAASPHLKKSVTLSHRFRPRRRPTLPSLSKSSSAPNHCISQTLCRATGSRCKRPATTASRLRGSNWHRLFLCCLPRLVPPQRSLLFSETACCRLHPAARTTSLFFLWPSTRLLPPIPGPAPVSSSFPRQSFDLSDSATSAPRLNAQDIRSYALRTETSITRATQAANMVSFSCEVRFSLP